MLYSYTYEDIDDLFERSPLITHIRDLTLSRMLLFVTQIPTYAYMQLLSLTSTLIRITWPLRNCLKASTELALGKCLSL